MASSSTLKESISKWQQWGEKHQQKQLINPFSDWEAACNREKIGKDDPRYGRPVEGSLTEYRGKMAGVHISREVVDLCQNISRLGVKHPDDVYTISFGKLFDAYTVISNKVVGMLMRARKHKLLDFEGEMLYQGRDEKVIITLYVVPERNSETDRLYEVDFAN